MNVTEPQLRSMGLRQLFSFLLAGRRSMAALLVIVSLISGLAEATAIALVVKAVGLLMSGDTGQVDFGPIDLPMRSALVLAVILVLLRLVASAWAADLGARVSANVREDLRNRLVRAYTNADWSVQVRDRSGEFAEITTAQVNEAGAIILAATQAVLGGTTLLALLATSAVINPMATAALIGIGAVLFLITRLNTKRAYEGIRDSATSRGNVASDIDSMCNCTEEMHVYGVADSFRRRVASSIRESEHGFYRGQRHGRMASASFQSATLLIVVLGAVALSYLPAGSDITSLGAVVILLIRGAGLAQQLQAFSSVLSTQRPYVELVARELDRYESSWPSYGATMPTGTERRIMLRNASFTYPGSTVPALSDVNVILGPTGAVGIQGPSGSGKSTMLQLLLGLRAPTRGTVTYGGVDLSRLSPAERSKAIAFVGQTPKLLPGTIWENISFFRDIPGPRVRQAAKRAAVLEDIEALPEKFQTEVGQRVDTVSGGQRQRISIARALAASPSVLVLDEPTSSLDSESEAIVVNTLKELSATMLVIIVSHRDAPLRICDTVLDIESGRVSTRSGITERR